ncbi:MAG: DUF4123 domain-containing protein [Gammaproteobacteria bacterium]|nr:DUF4123 domain-containing protein [Gammaproteobacteria bacterium]
MSNLIPTQAVRQHLFAVPETTVYVILDGASVPDLPQTLQQMGVDMECLFRGELEPDMAQVAPYLAVVPLEHPFTDWLLQEGWGRHWGIFVISKANLRTLRMHLRTFLKVYDPDLKPLYFRYYDPRVLRTYLPTCTEQELQIVFGPVLRYLAEGEDPAMLLKFWIEQAQLKSEQVQLGRLDEK